MKEIKKEKMWCYAAPDGEIQTRSVQPTKNMSREAICFREYRQDYTKVTYQDYQKDGYKLHRIMVTITLVK